MKSYSPQQLTQAKADWDYFSGKIISGHHTAALVVTVTGAFEGNHEGEDSFDDTVPGDHGAAKGRSQWHASRRTLILHNTGIDVWNSTPDQQREAMFREMTESWSWYKHVWDHLMATYTVQEAVTVLVVEYEQSGSQARDIARRTMLAQYWIDYAKAHNWTAAS